MFYRAVDASHGQRALYQDLIGMPILRLFGVKNCYNSCPLHLTIRLLKFTIHGAAFEDNSEAKVGSDNKFNSVTPVL